jgi:hypothetical protein
VAAGAEKAQITAMEHGQSGSGPFLRPCTRCGRPMTLVRTVPRLAALPELKTFQCKTCGHVESTVVEHTLGAPHIRGTS